MPQLGLFNFIFGFIAIFYSAASGVFLSFETTRRIIASHEALLGWSYLLMKSSHTHGNLFGMIHILFGLTLPYSRLKMSWKKLQTSGLILGTLSMLFLIPLKSNKAPQMDFDLLGVFIGGGLSLFLFSLITHIAGLSLKLYR